MIEQRTELQAARHSVAAHGLALRALGVVAALSIYAGVSPPASAFQIVDATPGSSVLVSLPRSMTDGRASHVNVLQFGFESTLGSFGADEAKVYSPAGALVPLRKRRPGEGFVFDKRGVPHPVAYATRAYFPHLERQNGHGPAAGLRPDNAHAVLMSRPGTAPPTRLTPGDGRVGVARLTLGGVFVDPWHGVNLLSVGGRRTFDVSDHRRSDDYSSARRSDALTRSGIEAAFARWQRLTSLWSAEIGLKGERSNDGGLRSIQLGHAWATWADQVRRQPYTSGRTGASGFVELVREISANSGTVSRARVFAFYDMQTVWGEDAVAGPYSASSAIAGLGARFTLLGWMRTRLAFARPVAGDSLIVGDDPEAAQVSFSVSATF